MADKIQTPKRRLGQAARFWLDVKATPSRILRGRERGEDVLLVTLLALVYFLAHWEETVRVHPFELAIYPLQDLPEALVPWGWVLTVVVLLINSWWLDHWLARESGVERELRPVWRWLRRVVGAFPILGLLLIPGWRWLIEKRPGWAFFECPEEKFTLEGLPQENSGAGRFQRWLDLQHTRLSPALVFSFWLFLLNSVILRFLVLELSKEQWEGLEFGLLASVVILRFVGLGLHSWYLRQWYRNSGRPLRQLLWQLPLAIGWFLPYRLAYLQVFLGLALLDRWRRWTLFQRSSSRPFSTGDQDLRQIGVGWRWFMGQLRFDELDRPYRYRSSIIRLLSFALIFEGALAILFLEKSEAGYSLAIPFVAVLLWGDLRGLWGLIKVFEGIVRYLRTGASTLEQGLVERSRLLTLLAVLTAFLFEGALTGEGSNRGAALFMTFMPWAQSLTLLYFAYMLISMLRLRQVDPHGMRWIILFFLFSGLGQSMQRHPRGAGMVVWSLALAVPLIAHLLAVRRVVWAIHPFRLSDIRRSELPRRIRLRLMAIVATGALPLGGLALPAALRARRRLEAEFDRLWPFEPATPARAPLQPLPVEGER
jgi:hypothetical protein